MKCEIVIPHDMRAQLHQHLFPGDRDEHGAVIAAGYQETPDGVRLLARDLFLAEDGVDYVPGMRGYRMLTADFVRDRALYCRAERLVYLAIHNHGGRGQVAFSPTDLASHERGYPALLDIVGGRPVGALVFAEDAVAGDIWLPDGRRIELTRARVVGPRLAFLYPSPPPDPRRRDDAYDRQARLFGDCGQAILGGLKVGVVGAGGVGMFLVELLARLGVGHLVIVDPERAEPTNLPRLPGAPRWAAMGWLVGEGRPAWLRRLGRRLAHRKVDLAGRAARRANPRIKLDLIEGDFVDDDVAQQFLDCDYVLLAADSMQARLVFNALVHQYYIPGWQVGSKVRADAHTGELLDVYSVVRPVFPTGGCLYCNGFIPAARLQLEAVDEETRRAQRYVEDDDVAVPSVITLNGIGASYAANELMLSATGVRLEGQRVASMYFHGLRGTTAVEEMSADPACLMCGHSTRSRRGRAGDVALPTRSAKRAT